MARKKLIPDEIREQVVAIVNKFNEENALPPESDPILKVLQLFGGRSPLSAGDGQMIGAYITRFRGAYLYLDRVGYSKRPSQICRLKWTGAMDDWEFSIYKYSDNGYDPDEWMFPGAEEIDGTVVGAMRAGNEAYPD